MIDTHAHLDFPDFDKDREETISRFFESRLAGASGKAGKGIAIMNIGVNLETSRSSVELAETHENIFAAVGFHPHEANRIDSSSREREFEELKKLATKNKVVAIGEVGLDYFRIKEDRQIMKQKELFAEQLDLARELNLPVVIHCRDAWDDLYEIISNSGVDDLNFVLHCYSGKKKDTKIFLKRPNVYFSFTGNITYPKPNDRAEELAEAVRMIPLDRIMLDSDCPFLAPQDKRGSRNEPSYIRYIAERIADIKAISVDEIERVTDGNARIFFEI